MRNVLLLPALLSLTFAPSRGAGAATLVVPDQYPTIQGAITAAASGDSIVVRPGTYAETLIAAGKDISIVGESPAPVLVSSGRILELGFGVTTATVLEGLVFRGGGASAGAAIFVYGGAGVTLRNCDFQNNVARVVSGSSYGGAIRLDPQCTADLDSCSFTNNSALSDSYDQCSGGAVYVSATGTLTAIRCRFHDNVAAGFEGGDGGAVAMADDAQARFEDCEFERNGAGYGGAIQAFGGLTVVRCRFDGNQGSYGGATIQTNGYLSAVTIERNVFVANDAISAFTIEAYGPGDLRGNTVALNGPLFAAGGIRFGGGLHVENNLVARNGGIGVWSDDALPVVRCNDVWSNGSGGVANYGGNGGDHTGSDGNISEDPLFCDPDNGNLALGPGSPCAMPAPCGLIGALGVACPAAGVPLPSRGAVGVRLLAPHPNPAATRVAFSFECARAGVVRLEVLDLAGRRVASPVDRPFDVGRHDVAWDAVTDDGRRLPPGAYVVRLRAGADEAARRFVLAR